MKYVRLTIACPFALMGLAAIAVGAGLILLADLISGKLGEP